MARKDQSEEAFEVYRAQGSDRSFVRVALELGLKLPKIQAWAIKSDWMGRILREHIPAMSEAKPEEQQSRAAAEADERAVSEAVTIQRRATEVLAKIEIDSPEEAAQMIRMALGIQREIRSKFQKR